MLDRRARRLYAPALKPVSAAANRAGVRADSITAAALIVGIGACVAAALSVWIAALALWLLNRGLDGLDGAVARQGSPSDLGGMLDFLADFVVYGGFIVAVAIAVPHARIACTALLAAYLLNNVALLSFATLIEKHGLGLGDERSLPFTAGLTEGSETILAYVAICLTPAHAELIAWIFTGMVLITVGQRIGVAIRTLG
ncbi:MAG: CDP-alcohol phosphatidyltransferase family protein [Solirubrobacteraceae bacterium]